jgi:hypothetical protein
VAGLPEQLKWARKRRERAMHPGNGGRWALVGEFTEIESGKRAVA